MAESLKQIQKRISRLKEIERKRQERVRLNRELFALKHRKLISTAEKIRSGAGSVGRGLQRTGTAFQKIQSRLKEAEARQKKKKFVQTESISDRINKALGGL